MPWRFKPTQRSVKLHPGQSTLAFYTAHNKSDKAITGGCGEVGVEHGQGYRRQQIDVAGQVA